MTQHQFSRTLTLREAAQDALSALEAIQLPEPYLLTRKRGVSRQEHEDAISMAIEEVEMHTSVIENLRAALAQPAYDIEGAMARIEKAGYDYRSTTEVWLGVIRSELIAAIKETT